MPSLFSRDDVAEVFGALDGNDPVPLNVSVLLPAEPVFVDEVLLVDVLVVMIGLSAGALVVLPARVVVVLPVEPVLVEEVAIFPRLLLPVEPRLVEEVDWDGLTTISRGPLNPRVVLPVGKVDAS